MERNLLKTEVGRGAICAAVGDVTAWCILAGIIALVRSDGSAHYFSRLAGWSLCPGYDLYRQPLLRRIEGSYLNGGLSYN